METLNEYVKEYKLQLKKGKIQKAYKGIMSFIFDLKTYLDRKYPDYHAGALYSGYMDMTYFAFTPLYLKRQKLKVAVVFLHEECKFELWLAAGNRKMQQEYINRLEGQDMGKYKLSEIKPGVDSIIAHSIVDVPDFDNVEQLKNQIENEIMEFVKDINKILA
ncbi:DUF7000 family protein [Alkalibacter mobilis]|uniref:DUF7000 family protein n=1 Tax=Alkalibacter mobilis TaxID=2787712 RepID=UPI00189DC6CC|nr:hypothetical protein [Alkalibacter mobilis]MBF7097532.1 hypothetical protein [Alkalibacter mobilis]